MRDSEPAVEREALRAIVQIGTPEAYKTVAEAIKAGDSERRDSILRALTTARDERAAGLFVHVIDHTSPRGNMETVYRLAIDALGQVGGDPHSVEALKRVLYRGEWWAPMRTSRLRAAAASALRATATSAAEQALEEAASRGPSGTRRAAKAILSTPAPRAQARRTE
jgi:HEAT repeat protein